MDFPSRPGTVNLVVRSVLRRAWRAAHCLLQGRAWLLPGPIQLSWAHR
jgi:hypothetical protein